MIQMKIYKLKNEKQQDANHQNATQFTTAKE